MLLLRLDRFFFRRLLERPLVQLVHLVDVLEHREQRVDEMDQLDEGAFEKAPEPEPQEA